MHPHLINHASGPAGVVFPDMRRMWSIASSRMSADDGGMGRQNGEDMHADGVADGDEVEEADEAQHSPFGCTLKAAGAAKAAAQRAAAAAAQAKEAGRGGGASAAAVVVLDAVSMSRWSDVNGHEEAPRKRGRGGGRPSRGGGRGRKRAEGSIDNAKAANGLRMALDLGTRCLVPSREFGVVPRAGESDHYVGEVTKASVTHVRLFFAEDDTSYWFTKSRVRLWLGARNSDEGAGEVGARYEFGTGGCTGTDAGRGCSKLIDATHIAESLGGDDFEICAFSSAEEMKSTAQAAKPSAKSMIEPAMPVALSQSDVVSPTPHLDATECQVCRDLGYADEILLCAGCDKGCHLFCFVPPLRSVPDGLWFCPWCERACARTVAANW